MAGFDREHAAAAEREQRNRDWAARGFASRLLPIIPPDAPLSSGSKVPAENRGKVPGKLGIGGWHGYDWRSAPPATNGNLRAWAASGAGLGIRLGDGLIAVDIDVLDERLAEEIARLVSEHLGSSPVRIGRPPKRLMLYRVADDVSSKAR
ncbi:bifunctional DNA primase/polymerase [Marinimicrococcus flavescens]|uniref:DNA primase/polymerase bifunctional N-terminal domain-containing protein n=1 Tax=Marinimicrococcus flavescens TaxID=3031815 RepID=A0AAP3XR85_9PROT|nr:hypothetical protein [Marinimicrococcus flavescens]